jgi:predicted GIY-YIG superfamily endonuclease
VESFYAYVLKLDDGSFYVGQSRELRERMVEHRDGRTASTAGKNPKLQYFEECRTREAAMAREAELRKTAKYNGREIRRMVTHLQDLVRELDFS